MLLKFTADWCHNCHKMEKSFNKREVSAVVNRHFIPIKVDADQKKELVEELEIVGFPTTVVVSPEFKIQQKIVGYLKEDELLERLEILCPIAPPGRALVRNDATAPPASAPTQSAAAVPAPANAIQQVSNQWAFDQVCLVELVENARLAQGDPAFQMIYRDRLICFVSKAHKRAFLNNPERYWPALNGNCPIELAEGKELVVGSPELGAIYRSQLWFFSSPEARLKFANAPQQYLLPGLGIQE